MISQTGMEELMHRMCAAVLAAALLLTPARGQTPNRDFPLQEAPAPYPGISLELAPEQEPLAAEEMPATSSSWFHDLLSLLDRMFAPEPGQQLMIVPAEVNRQRAKAGSAKSQAADRLAQARSLYRIGETYCKKGDWVLAQKCFAEVWRLCPGSKLARLAVKRIQFIRFAQREQARTDGAEAQEALPWPAPTDSEFFQPRRPGARRKISNSPNDARQRTVPLEVQLDQTAKKSRPDLQRFAMVQGGGKTSHLTPSTAIRE
jgi:hypothetical protein